MNLPNPCHGCQERTATCHGTCRRYATYAERCEEIRQARAKVSILDAPGKWLIRNVRRKLNNYRK